MSEAQVLAASHCTSSWLAQVPALGLLLLTHPWTKTVARGVVERDKWHALLPVVGPALLFPA